MEPFFYRPPFLKHLHNLVVNGFYARDLDADDFAFLEYVKLHGVANGSLPGSESVLLEELEFWQLPYGIAPDVERHIGLPQRPIMTAEQRAARRARQNAWHARRVIREQERAIAEAELERERRECEKAKERRKQRWLLSDIEWEAADPRHRAKFGKTINRHYVPQWKFDEQHKAKSSRRRLKAAVDTDETTTATDGKSFVKQKRRDAIATKRRLRAEHAAEAKRLAAEREQRRAEAERLVAEREQRRVEQERLAAEKQQRHRAKQAERLTAEEQQRIEEAADAKWMQEQEEDRQRREKIIADAHQTVDRLRNDAVMIPRTADELQQDILTLLRGSHITGQVWTQESIMRATGCDDEDFLDKCLAALVRGGRLRKVPI